MAGNNLIKLLRCNSTTRANSTEILLDGQPLVEQDTHLMYVGDGVTEAKNLTPMGGGAQLRDNCVLYSEAQTLTEEQKAQARENIGAVSAREIGVKTYFHNLVLSAAGSQIVYIVIATDTSTPFTTSSLEEWLKNKGFIMKPATSLIGANPDFSKSKIYSPPKLSIVVEEGAYLNNEYPIMIVVGIYYYQYTDGSGSAQLMYYSGNSFNINNSISLSIISDIVLDMI